MNPATRASRHCEFNVEILVRLKLAGAEGSPQQSESSGSGTSGAARDADHAAALVNTSFRQFELPGDSGVARETDG